MQIRTPTEIQTVSESTPKPVTGWPQVVLIAAGIYNILFALWTIVFPTHYFSLAGIPAPLYSELWQYIGMIVGIYGVGYLIAASDIIRYWPIVLLGLAGKILGSLGFAVSVLAGTFSFHTGWLIITNDLIWAVPFTIIILKAQLHEMSLPRVLSKAARNTIESYRNIFQQLQNEKSLLVFIRHSGCIFAHEWLKLLSDARHTIEKHNIQVVLVHMSNNESSLMPLTAERKFIYISDPEQILYKAFNIPTASLWQAIHPRVWLRALDALQKKQCRIGKVDGDGFQTAGIIAISNATICFSAAQQNISELPDLSSAIAALSDDVISAKNPEADFTLFYDGGCPLCSREIRWVRQYTAKRVSYVDITTPEFKPEVIGTDLDLDFFMREIRGQASDGTLISGVAVFRELYKRTGIGWLFAPTAWPIIRPIADCAYSLFARLRYRHRKNKVCTSDLCSFTKS